MDAIKLIEDNLDVVKILEHYDFEQVNPSGNYVRACCKIHGGKSPSAFVINIENGLWSCHTGECGNGNIFQLVQKLDNVLFPVAVHTVADVLRLDINNLEIVARNNEESKELKQWMKIMKKQQQTEIEEYRPNGATRKLKQFKDFQLSTIETFGLLYFDDFHGIKSDGESFIIHDCLGFPLTRNGTQVGISIRQTKKYANPKWLHQPSHIKVSNILYNYDNAIGQPNVVVVEGITDVWAYHEIGVVAVAIFGSSISDEQKKLLLRLGSDLTFSFDGDEAGKKVMKQAFELFKNTTNIKAVWMPEGADPESLKREELKEHYEKRRNFVF